MNLLPLQARAPRVAQCQGSDQHEKAPTIRNFAMVVDLEERELEVGGRN
jgi:hypothetical protein